ncbi:hypothetical protein BC829DRAFT_281794 [Chytridium lagenaria]|nr:hypothetical protein BC829DRAFT_281794 [Chytridium lagenaria]
MMNWTRRYLERCSLVSLRSVLDVLGVSAVGQKSALISALLDYAENSVIVDLLGIPKSRWTVFVLNTCEVAVLERVIAFLKLPSSTTKPELVKALLEYAGIDRESMSKSDEEESEKMLGRPFLRWSRIFLRSHSIVRLREVLDFLQLSSSGSKECLISSLMMYAENAVIVKHFFIPMKAWSYDNLCDTPQATLDVVSTFLSLPSSTSRMESIENCFYSRSLGLIVLWKSI